MSAEPDLDLLIRSTGDAFRAVLHAVLDRDGHAAREVLHGSAARRALVAAVGDELRDRDWVPAPQLAEELRFVADLARVGDLVEHLARHVVGGGDRRPLSPARRMEVAVLLDAGGRRLGQLADGLVGCGLDPSYRGCGSALREVADRGARDRSTTVVLCGAIAVTLLQASRHAAHAA